MQFQYYYSKESHDKQVKQKRVTKKVAKRIENKFDFSSVVKLKVWKSMQIVFVHHCWFVINWFLSFKLTVNYSKN